MTRPKGTDARRRHSRRCEIRKRGLVVSEGTVTEKQYIERLKQVLRDSQPGAVDVKSIGLGKDPKTVLEYAKQECDKASSQEEPYDWCCIVVDVDQHATLKHCVQSAPKFSIDVVVSNPCFEVWLIWHVKDFNRASDAKALGSELEGVVHKAKHLSPRFPIKAYTDAEQRAKRADPNTDSNRIGPNPSSAMPVLINLMRGGV